MIGTIIGRATNGAFEQISDPVLQNPVARQTNRIFDPFGFEKLVDLGIGKAGVGSEINERDLAAVARHNRLQNLIPAIRAVNVAGTKRAPFEVAELVEQKQRMVAGAGIMAVPDAVLLFAVRRAHARIHIEHDTSRRTTTMDGIDPLAGKIG